MSQEFAAVLVTGLAIFGLVFVSTQVDGDIFNTSEPVDQMTFFTQNYGELGNARPDSRNIEFGDFSVGEARGDILVFRRERGTVSKRFLGGDKIQTTYNATQPRTGSVTFEVLGKSGNGPLFVKANGQKVFEEHLVSGGTPEIEIPAEALSTGQNTITIGSASGLLSSSKYTIEDVKVRVNDRKFHDHVDTFQMYDYEIADFVEAELSFEITEAVKNEPLTVHVNDREVYQLDRVRGRETVDVNPSNADLHPGLNVIKFETDGESFYSVEDASINVRYLGRTEEALIRSEWNMDQSQLDFANQNQTRETVKFNYRTLLGSPSPLIFDINGERNTLMPSNGENTLRIQNDLLQQQNTMIIRNNGSYQLNNLRVVSERVEN